MPTGQHYVSWHHSESVENPATTGIVGAEVLLPEKMIFAVAGAGV